MSTEKDDKTPYEVGYKKTPVRSRFKPGVSGNLKGRPRKPPPEQIDYDALLNGPVPVTINGQRKELPPKEIELRKMVQKAVVGGSLKAIIYLLEQFERYGAMTPTQTDGGGILQLPSGMPSAMGWMLVTEYGTAPFTREQIAAAAQSYRAKRSEQDRLVDDHMDYKELRP